MSEERLLHYVRKAIEIQDSGATLDLEELCSDAPELIDAVRETLALDAVATSAAVEDALVGQTLNDRYALRECIGIGAMGAVYEADDVSLGRRVAIKVLPPGVFGEGKRRERFLREARVLAALNHPHIVPIYDHGSTALGLHYIVMERLFGSSLAKVISPTHTSSGGLPPTGWIASELGLPVANDDYIPQVVHWMLEVIAALHEAHQAGVCHRDVKPSNVFLTEDGRAVLLDFGIAARSGDASMTTRGSALGTPAYMAPEQVARDGAATPAMDVYGVCATLYHLVSMQPPYTGDSIEVLGKLQREDPRPLKSIDARLPTDLCAIIEKGLERNAARRYRDMAELEADLRAFLAHMPVKARPITRLTRALRHVRRRPLYFVAGMAVAAVALSITVPAAWRAAEVRAKADHARLFAALAPDLAVEGSPERRPRMPGDERERRIAQLGAILTLDPDDVWSRALRAALLQDHGDPRGAAADVAAIVGDSRSGYLRELVARYRKVPAGAAGVGALDLTDLPAPTTDLGRFLCGFHLRRLHDLEAADAVLAAAPGHLPARYLRLGVRLGLLGTAPDPTAKEESVRWLLDEAKLVEERLGTSTARTLWIRGSALVDLGEIAAGAIELERSLALQPDSFSTLNNLANAYRRLDRLDRVEEVLGEAIALRPWNLNAQLQLIVTIGFLGRFDEAIGRLDGLGDGDLATPVDRLRVRCDVEVMRYLAQLGSGDRESAAATADRILDACEQAIREIGDAEAEANKPFRTYTVLATLVRNDDRKNVLYVLRMLAGNPLNPIHLEAAAELIDDHEFDADPFTKKTLEFVRDVLRAQAEARRK